MKTKEQQAEEYAKEQKNIRLFGQRVCRNISIEERQEDAFIAGYEAAQQWIPVTGELPPPFHNEALYSDDVFVTDGDSCEIAFYHTGSGKWMVYGDDDGYIPTHWLPIPKLPTK